MYPVIVFEPKKLLTKSLRKIRNQKVKCKIEELIAALRQFHSFGF